MKICLAVLFIPIVLVAQEFQITTDGSRRFSLDKFINEIYWEDLTFNREIFKTNLTTKQTEKSNFPSLPIFANNSHLAAYEFNEKLYLYDFETKDSILLTDSVLARSDYFSFSPMDKFIYYANLFYDLKENKKIIIQENLIDLKPVWENDTTVIIGEFNGDVLRRYCFSSNKFDTIITIPDSLFLISYDYNIKKNILAYSVEDENAEPSNCLLKFIYIDKNENVTIFDHWNGIPDMGCWHSFMLFTELKWSNDGKRISFYSHPVINSGSGVLVHFLDSNFTKLYTDCDQYGVKVETTWKGNDTIIYADLTRNQIYGFDIISPITNIQTNTAKVSNSIYITNYPNPFNNSTNISLTTNQKGSGKFSIYNIIGQKINSYNMENLDIGTYSFVWDGTTDANSHVSAGIYFSIFEIVNNSGKKIMTSKKLIYLK